MALLRALLCAAGLLGTAHSILHELNPTNPEHHEQIKTLLEDCQLQMIFVSPPQTAKPPRPTSCGRVTNYTPNLTPSGAVATVVVLPPTLPT